MEIEMCEQVNRVLLEIQKLLMSTLEPGCNNIDDEAPNLDIYFGHMEDLDINLKIITDESDEIDIYYKKEYIGYLHIDNPDIAKITKTVYLPVEDHNHDDPILATQLLTFVEFFEQILDVNKRETLHKLEDVIMKIERSQEILSR